MFSRPRLARGGDGLGRPIRGRLARRPDRRACRGTTDRARA